MPLSQLAIDGLKNPRQSFEDGQELPLKVIEFDQDQKKIVLSVREYFKNKDQADYEGYLADHPIKEGEPIEEAAADKDDEMESWGDAHDGGAAPAESPPVENEAADEDDDE